MKAQPSRSRCRIGLRSRRMTAPIRRGATWLVDLKPQSHPEEPSKLRPCLVMQEDCVNAIHGSVIIVPVSSSSERSYPSDDPVRVHVGAFAKSPGDAPEHSWALADCVRAVAKRRFNGDASIHVCPPAAMKKVELALKVLMRLR